MQELYFDTSNGNQKEFLRELKEKRGCSWDVLAKELGVNRSMVFKYLNQTSRVPLRRVEKSVARAGVQDKGVWANGRGYAKNIIRKPQLDESLAEFLGIMAGDGNACSNGYCVSVTCSAIVDKEFITTRVTELFDRLFGITPTMRNKKNVLQCRMYSKELFEFLAAEHDFPTGRRKNRNCIPRKILENKRLLVPYLRGLFDTDGSFHRHHKNSAAVEYVSKSPAFLGAVCSALRGFGFLAGLSGKSVYIYDKGHIDIFFKLIKPNNIKHTIKYKIFKDTDKVPTHAETILLLERPSPNGRVRAFH